MHTFFIKKNMFLQFDKKNDHFLSLGNQIVCIDRIAFITNQIQVFFM